MHDFPLEVFSARHINATGQIELANTRDQEVGLNGIPVTELSVLATGDIDCGLPLHGGVIPFRFVDGSVESSVLVELVFVGYVCEVVLARSVRG